MKKAASLTIFSTAVIALVFILRSFFPKYHGILVFLAILLLGDSILWWSVRKWMKNIRNPFRHAVSILYWLPSALLFLLVIYGFIVPFHHWNVPFRSFSTSFILMGIACKIIPFLILIVTWPVMFVLEKTGIKGSKWFSYTRLAGWISGGFIWLLMLAGMIFWVYDFQSRTVDFRDARVPPSFDQFRIVQISDIHLGNWTCRHQLAKAADLINQMKPDLVVFTGDMFTFSTEDGRGFEPELGRIHARSGVMAVLGNHDYGDYIRWKNPGDKTANMEELDDFYHKLGWKLLKNQSSVIRKGADSIAIIGVENWGASRRFQRFGNIDAALAGVGNSLFRILLSHDPSYWDSIISKKHPEICLTLSGHTHGGQFGFETGNLRWSILAFSNHLWGGQYTADEAGYHSVLYVNRGLGTVGYCGRVGIRPEITLIVLHSERK